jgi:glycosyltransferase involved in cell wall biosynthesis
MAFISFEHFPILRTNSPNKFFDALAMGLGIVINQKGWIHDVVAKHRLGIFHDPSDPRSTIQQLELLAGDSEYLDLTKKRSREVAIRYFSKEIAIKNILFVLKPERYKPNPIYGAYIPTV